MSRRSRRNRNQTVLVERATRQPNIKPGAVNFQPVKDTVIETMYQNFGPQKDQGYMYSPGAPIRPVPGITPPTGPRGYEYPVGYNIAQLPRSTEQYSFTDLRQLASMYYAIAMCEQVWFDYITKLELVIEPREDLMREDQDETSYQDDIQTYKDFFAYPDRDHDLHTWMQMAVRDQLEIDAVAIYVRRDRAGRPYALDLLDGSTIKPIIDDRGRRPQPPFPAYEQYVYGVPACFLTTDDLIYVKETDRVESVYGRSRVEKILLNVNIALRKQTKDLARFTDGTVPQGLLQPSIDVQWSQQEIEAYEIQFNNLMAGNDEMRARIKVLPRGFEYKPTDDPDVHIELDTYMLNVTAANFGITMSELAFIADINRSSGETQENVVYRRAMGPLMSRYAKLFTLILEKYFNERRFVVRWKGFEEVEDFTNKATAYATLTTAGILSPSRAAHLLNLPVDVDLPSPFLASKTGVIMMQDLADPEVQEALKEALIAGGGAAATSAPGNGQPPDEEEPDDEQNPDGKAPKPDKKPPTKGTQDDSKETDRLDASAILEAIERLLADNEETRHNPGGDAHDQKTHGNWGHPGYGSHDKTKANKQNMQAKSEGKPHVKTTKANHSLKQKKTTKKKTTKTAKKGSTASKEKARAALARRAMNASKRFQKMSERKVTKTWTREKADAADSIAAEFSSLANHLDSGESGSFPGIAGSILSDAATIYGKDSVAYAHVEKLVNSIDARMEALRADIPDEWYDEDGEPEEEDDEEEDDEIYPTDDPWNDEPETTSMMLAFFLDPEIADQICIPGGVEPEDMHLTLAHLGDINQTVIDTQALCDALKVWAAQCTPLVGKLSGVGRFEKGEELTPVVALPDMPDLPGFRQKLVDFLASLRVQVSSNHGYTPHITICYIPEEDDIPFDRVPALPLRFSSLCLAVGDDRTFFPLGGGSPSEPGNVREQAQELTRWKRRALEDVDHGRGYRSFVSAVLPKAITDYVTEQLSRCQSHEGVSHLFSGVTLASSPLEALARWESQYIAQNAFVSIPDFYSHHLSPFTHFLVKRGLVGCTSVADAKRVFTRARGSILLDTGAWQQVDKEVQRVMADYASRGVVELEWITTPEKGTCDECLRNAGQRVLVGYPFPTGALTVTQHPNCACLIREIMADGSSKLGDGIRPPLKRSAQKVSKQGSCTCDICTERAGKPVGEDGPPYHDGCDCSVERGEKP